MNVVLLNTFIAVINAAYYAKLQLATSVWVDRMLLRYCTHHLGLPSRHSPHGNVMHQCVYWVLGRVFRIRWAVHKWKANRLWRWNASASESLSSTVLGASVHTNVSVDMQLRHEDI
eukprot:PhF_6_TR7921/c0_g2_i1/m.11839